MSRQAGRRGRVYMGLASDTAAAEPIAFLNSWSISLETDKLEVTAFGDTNKVYVAGLPDSSGEFGGWYDDATVQTYQAAVDGLPRKFYLYPSVLLNTQYFFGTILPDMSIESGVGDAISISSSWNAASNIAKVG